MSGLCKALRRRGKAAACQSPPRDGYLAPRRRLRAHHRAPMRAVVGQGGHASELERCPHCRTVLPHGLPHVGCAHGLSAPRQAAKRRKALQNRHEEQVHGFTMCRLAVCRCLWRQLL